MKNMSRVFLFGALILVLLLAGCAGEEATSTAVGPEPGQATSLPATTETEAVGTAETATTGTAETAETETTTTATEAATEAATATATSEAAGPGTGTPGTPGVPGTGGDINVIECQFCIGTMAYALLDVPAVATFEITDPASPDPDTQCNVVDTFEDRQVVFCRAPEDTSLTLDVCTDANTCSEVTVELQTCPLAAGTAQPGATVTRTPGAGATATATAGTPEATATGPTATPTP